MDHIGEAAGGPTTLMNAVFIAVINHKTYKIKRPLIKQTCAFRNNGQKIFACAWTVSSSLGKKIIWSYER